MKKSNKERGLPLIIKANCGQQGCDITQYTQPFAGTKEAFTKHVIEKFKTYTTKQAA